VPSFRNFACSEDEGTS